MANKQTNKQASKQTNKHKHTNTRTHEHTNTRTHEHTNTRTHEHTNTRTHEHTNTRTHEHTNTRTHEHTNTQTHKHTNTQTHKHTNTNTQTHKHTNKQTSKQANKQASKQASKQTKTTNHPRLWYTRCFHSGAWWRGKCCFYIGWYPAAPPITLSTLPMSLISCKKTVETAFFFFKLARGIAIRFFVRHRESKTNHDHLTTSGNIKGDNKVGQ